MPVRYHLLLLLNSAVSLVHTESESLKDFSGAPGLAGGCLLSPFYPLGCTGCLQRLFSISTERSEVKGQRLPFHLLILAAQDNFFPSMANAASDVQRMRGHEGAKVSQSRRAQNPADVRESMAYLYMTGPRWGWA